MAETRIGCGVSQEALATQLGMDQPTLSKIETAQRRVTLEDFMRWAAALNLPLVEATSAVHERTTVRRQADPE